METSSFHNTQERNGLPHGQQCIENHRVIDGLWQIYIFVWLVHHQVCTRMRATKGQCATLNLCNDIETNPGPPIHVLILLKQSRHHVVKVILCTLVKMLENITLL